MSAQRDAERLSEREYYEAEASAIADDILRGSYRYGDDLEPLARAYLALARQLAEAERPAGTD